MGLKTFDRWPDGHTTVDKEMWSSDEPPPEENKPQENETPLDDGDNFGLKLAFRPIKHFTLMRAEFPLEIIDEINKAVDIPIISEATEKKILEALWKVIKGVLLKKIGI